MDIKIPEVGESVREALLAKWFKRSGDFVKRDEPICEIETDKITLDLNADAAGVLSVAVAEGTTVPVGTVIGTIDGSPVKTGVPEDKVPLSSVDQLAAPTSPSVRSRMREYGIDPAGLHGTGKGGRITLEDVTAHVEGVSSAAAVSSLPADSPPLSLPPDAAVPSAVQPAAVAEKLQQFSVRSEDAPVYTAGREERRPMSPIRRRIAERLLAARQQTAMLTTFSEADLSRVKTLRNEYRDKHQLENGGELGLMPFFVKASVVALKEYAVVNASIDGDDIVYHNYYDIGIAIGGEKGLVVPILRSADNLKLQEIDAAIAGFSAKIKSNQLSISDITGGTFTISNGGVYGSMLSTPIINPPQSAVLGMHAIQERPVVRDGQIVIRPMMYLALSYDHRIIDGREAVGFLKKVKECIEEPEELLLEG